MILQETYRLGPPLGNRRSESVKKLVNKVGESSNHIKLFYNLFLLKYQLLYTLNNKSNDCIENLYELLFIYLFIYL